MVELAFCFFYHYYKLYTGTWQILGFITEDLQYDNFIDIDLSNRVLNLDDLWQFEPLTSDKSVMLFYSWIDNWEQIDVEIFLKHTNKSMIVNVDA